MMDKKYKKQLIPGAIYVASAIAFFVVIWIFMNDLITTLTEQMEIPVDWANGLLTEQMIVAALVAITIVLFMWAFDRLMYMRRKKR